MASEGVDEVTWEVPRSDPGAGQLFRKRLPLIKALTSAEDPTCHAETRVYAWQWKPLMKAVAQPSALFPGVLK